MRTQQIDFWSGVFGQQYTARNTMNQEDWDGMYIKNFGLTRSNMNEAFLDDLRRDLRILEVGSNTGH